MFVGRSRKQRAAAATTKTTTRAISSATATAALIGCTLLLSAYLGTHSAWAMSIERLAIERNELQQQTETPAAAVSDNVLVVDDMQLEAVPSVAGDDDNTDMYMLVPANIAAEEEPVPASGNSIDEKLNDEEETAALSGDMLMLETDDALGMQMVELPSVVPVADEAVLSVNNDDDDNEIESVPELVEEAIEQLVATEAEVPVAVEQAAQQAEVALEEAIVESTTPLADDESLKTDAAEAQQQIVENVAEKIPQIMATLETAPAVDEPLHDEAQVDDKESTNEEQQLISSQDAQNTNAVGELETESVTETALVDAGEELAEQETVTDTIEQVESNEKPNEINEEKQNDGDELAESVTPAQEDSVAAAEEEKEHETAEAEATTEAPLVSEPLEVEAAEATAEQTQQQANDEPEAEQEAAEVQQDDETATTLAPAAVESTDEVATTEASIAESQPQVMANDKDSDKLAEIAEQHIQADEIANNDVLSEHNNEKELPAEAEAQQQEEEQLQTVTEAADIQMDDVDANTPAIDVATTEAAAADEIVDEMPMEIAAEKKEEAVAQPAQMSEAALLGGQQTATTTTTVEDKTEAEETVMTDKDDTPINADDESQQQQTATENLIQMDDAESEHIDELAPVAIVNIEEPTTTHENAEEGNSLLTTIIQVPVQQQQEQQQAAAVETTTQLPQHNVADSVLNYVNASFIQQTTEQTPPLKTEVLATPTEPEAFNAQLRRYDGAQVWRIVVQNDKDKKMADELQTKYDGQLWKEVKQEVDYLLKPQVLAAAERHIRSANLSRIVLIDNLQQVIEVENPSAEEIVMLQNRKGHRLSWQAYHRLEDIHGFIDYMAATYPDICSTETIGYSIQKRPLKILKISNGNASNPSIWLDGGMHAREWISPATVTFIANQLIEGWEDLPEHMRQINYYLHPVANPDGYEYSHTTDRLWRKNLRAHGRQCPGVDLNRNFGYKWGGKGTSASPCSQTYRGSKAFSEPETFYISKFISSYPRNTFQAYLSFHSYGQYILYPWGYDYHLTTDRADLDRVARQAGTSITKSTGVKYTVGSSATTLYPAAGGSDDWAKGIAGIKYAYTVEMGDTGRYGFVLPARFIHSNGKDGYTFIETVARAINEERSKQNRKRALKARRA